MSLYKIILVLAILYLLVLRPQRVIADPVEISSEHPNIKVYAFEKVLERWGDEQWFYFNDLIKKESHWDNEAQNPDSTAYGYGQLLDSTWKTVGCKKTSDKEIQIDCTMKYIELRYGTPEKAIKFWNKNKWY
jgi:hypothetical protein